jgi:hypothetical protein
MIQFDRLLSTDSAKAAKALGFGYLNGILYAAPHSTAGVGDLCPSSTAGCRALCLGLYSGQASMVADLENGTNSVRDSRVAKARLFMSDRVFYLNQIALQIVRLSAKAEREGLKACIRLNGSTDIPFERMGFALGGKAAEKVGAKAGERVNLIDLFECEQFVDYTKIISRLAKAPRNLCVTLSRSEANETECLDALADGHNVAVVFAHGLPVSRRWKGFRVIDGDKHDLRHLDPRDASSGFVIGLSPKGAKAKRDMSGFVLRDY